MTTQRGLTPLANLATLAMGQRMWDVMPVIQAVEGDALFSLSGRGTVRLTDKAETIFTPSATGNCRYQLPGSEAWAAQMLEKIRKANKQR